MAEGMRVFTDATQSSPSGCKNSIARLLQKDVRRARYLDPRTSRWLSTDPALTDYLPLAPVDENAKKHNQNLPGMGGIYNTVNFHLYHYAGNNPVKYIDPDGESVKSGLLKMGLAASEIVGGIALAGSTGGVGAVAGTIMILDGIGRFALGMADFTASCAENKGIQTTIKSENIPSSIGGMIGATIDKKNKECFTDTGKIGPNQKLGEKINAAVSYMANTYDYANTIKSTPEVINTGKEAFSVIKNEASHVYDTVDTATTICK